jgi:hypothetical protein
MFRFGHELHDVRHALVPCARWENTPRRALREVVGRPRAGGERDHARMAATGNIPWRFIELMASRSPCRDLMFSEATWYEPVD